MIDAVQIIAQAAEAPAALYQYGALGVALLGTAYAVRVLFQREVRAHDLERQRADRMESEVRRLNMVIQEKIVPVLSDATKTISEALTESRRRGGL